MYSVCVCVGLPLVCVRKLPPQPQPPRSSAGRCYAGRCTLLPLRSALRLYPGGEPFQTDWGTSRAPPTVYGGRELQETKHCLISCDFNISPQVRGRVLSDASDLIQLAGPTLSCSGSKWDDNLYANENNLKRRVSRSVWNTHPVPRLLSVYRVLSWGLGWRCCWVSGHQSGMWGCWTLTQELWTSHSTTPRDKVIWLTNTNLNTEFRWRWYLLSYSSLSADQQVTKH